MSLITRRELAIAFAGLAATSALRADGPKPTAIAIDHVKLRVASSGASAMFYHNLFGGEIISVRNATFPDTSLVNEFFLKIGARRFPYLALAQVRDNESPGLDHVSLMVTDPAAVRSTLERNGVSLIDPGHWFRDRDGTLMELMPGPTFGIQAQSIRVALPSNLHSVRPAFEPTAMTRFCLHSPDVPRSARFFHEIFEQRAVNPLAAGAQAFDCGGAILEFRPTLAPQPAGLDRIVVAVRGVTVRQARRILERRGIQPSGSRNEILFPDPDANLLELIAA